jgi:hypothetical protein
MEQYKTQDIVLAATLKVHGYALADIEILQRRGIFVFEDVDAEFINSYDLGRQTVEPVGFNNAIKSLTTSVRRMITD